MKYHLWTPAELQVLRDQYPYQVTKTIAAELGLPLPRVYAKAAQLGLHKSNKFFATSKSGRIFKGGQLGQQNQFAPGHTTWNKGLAFDSGGRSHETRFKKGDRCGAAHKNWVPVGSYRINSFGILDKKISDLGRGPRDWEAVARIVWKKANGPIPDGHIIVFKPGRKTNVLELITNDAVECISRAENAQRNHPARRSPELSKLYQLKGAITRQVNRIKQSNQTS